MNVTPFCDYCAMVQSNASVQILDASESVDVQRKKGLMIYDDLASVEITVIEQRWHI